MTVTMFFGAGPIPAHLLVLRAFFMGAAPELIDSARIDGAGE